MIVTCTSCKADNPYLIKDYLNYLSIKSGIGDSEEIIDNFESLKNWGIVDDNDYELLNERLDNAYLNKTIKALLDKETINSELVDNDDYVSETKAKEIVDEAVYVINNKKFEPTYEYEYKVDLSNKDEAQVGDYFFDEEDKTYKKVIEDGQFENAEFEDIFENFEIADSYEIDFSNSEVIPLQEEEKSSYINNKFTLLSSKNHVFNKDGFRISYTLNKSGIDVHVSKKIDKTNVYVDANINSVKPTFKWTYEKGDFKNCYFSISMNTTNSIGASIGKYGNYYLKFKDLDSSSFLSSIKSMVVQKDDEVEATIPICEVKTPIPNAPFAYINMKIGIKLYVSGRAELVIYNSHMAGCEIKNGSARFFYEHDDDLDTILKASSKAALALNVGLDATEYKLCDIELDGGVKAEVKSTLHLYDSDFNDSVVSSDIAYSTLDEVSKDNPYVKVCGDVSLYWLLDLKLNTSKTMLAKLGFSKTYHIMDDDNQVFGNLHHIENGQFVKSCTRKSKTTIKNEEIVINTSNKIVLNTYAEVLLEKETFNIEVLSIPSNYDISDIRYTSSDNSVARVEGTKIIALKCGSAKINVHTSDNKYNSYINILVSTG